MPVKAVWPDVSPEVTRRKGQGGNKCADNPKMTERQLKGSPESVMSLIRHACMPNVWPARRQNTPKNAMSMTSQLHHCR